MQITQKTIARELGVSVQSVSLALRNHPSVSPALRKRVHAKAAELGYRKNPLVSALMATRGRETAGSDITTLAYITFCPHLRSKVPSVRKEIFAGIQARSKELGFQVEEFCLAEPDLGPPQLERILRARGIQAVLLAPPPNTTTSLDLDWSPFSVVAVGRSLRTPRVHYVTSGIYEPFLNMMQELHRMGYRRPGLIMDLHHDENQHGQWRSLFEYTSRHLYGVPTPLVLHQTRHLDRNMTLNWIRQHGPDVLLSGNAEVRRVAETGGFRIPETMGYVSLEPIPGEGEACIRNHGTLIGAAAVDRVTAGLYRNERGIPAFQQNIQIEGSVQKNETIRMQFPESGPEEIKNED